MPYPYLNQDAENCAANERLFCWLHKKGQALKREYRFCSICGAFPIVSGRIPEMLKVSTFQWLKTGYSFTLCLCNGALILARLGCAK